MINPKRYMDLTINGVHHTVGFRAEYNPFTDSFDILECDMPGQEGMIRKFLIFTEHNKGLN